MGVYNPGTPRILGEEWVGIRNEDITFSPIVNVQERGHTFTPTTSRTLQDGRFYISSPPPSAVSFQQIGMSVYKTGTEAETGPVRMVTIPCNGISVTGSGFSGAPLSTFTLQDPGDQAYITVDPQNNVNQKTIVLQFAALQYAQLLNGKRILKVRLVHQISWNRFNAGNTALADDPPTFDSQIQSFGLFTSGIPPTNASSIFYAPQPNRYGDALNAMGIPEGLPSEAPLSYRSFGETDFFWFTPPYGPNPSVGQSFPWRYQELSRFDVAAGPDRIGVRYEFGASTLFCGFYNLGYAALEVYFCEETRVAYGNRISSNQASTSNVSYTNNTNLVTMRDTSLALNPVLAAGQQYTVVVTSPDIGDVNGPITAEGQAAAIVNTYPSLGAVRELAAISSHTGVQVNVTQTPGQVFTKQVSHVLPQLSLHTSAAPLPEVHVYGRRAAAQVYGTVTATQEILDAGVPPASYPQVRYFARRFGDTTIPLTVNSPSVGGLVLPGVAGSYASTVDTPALDIVGDIELRFDGTLPTWAPVSASVLIAKLNSPGNLSYQMYLDSAGLIHMAWSAGGAVITGDVTSTVPVPVTSGRLAVRATLDVDNGAAGRTITFYTAPTMAGPWTQLGAPVIQAGVTSIFSGTANLEVGTNSGGTASPLTGTVHSIQVLNGIATGTQVANPYFSSQPPGTTSFSDAATRLWTINGTATIVGNNATISNGLRLPGTAGNYASTPDNAALDIVGDIELLVDLTPASWQPTTFQTLIGKWDSGPNQRSYRLGIIQGTGLLQLAWSTTGTAGTTLAEASTIPVPAPTNGRLAVAAILDVDNGAAGHTVSFYTAPTMAGPFTQLGLPVTTAGVTSVFSGSAPVEVGTNTVGTTEPLTGTVYSAQILNGIGLGSAPAVANPDFAAQPAGTTSFTDAAGRVWTINGATANIGGAFAGATNSITATTFDALPEIIDGWRQVDLRLASPAAMGGGGNPQFVWSAPGELIGNRWEVLGVYAPAVSATPGNNFNLVPAAQRLSSATYGQPSAGDSINMGWVPQYAPPVSATADDPTADAVVLFSQDMPTVTGLVVLGASQAVTGIGQLCGINPWFIPNAISYNRVSWSATSASVPITGFGYYELQRQDSLTTWQTIMFATSPTVTGFSDFEARASLSSDYRIRAVNSSLFAGPWSSTVSLTMAAPGITGTGMTADDHVVIFTSNAYQNGSKNLAYSLAWESAQPTEAFTFPEASFTQYQAMYNRNFFVAFRPTERGGEQWQRTILVQAAAIPPETLADFTSLRDMAWTNMPYVCVRDEDGNRWFANVTVPTGRVMRDRKLYFADIGVVEVTDTAAPTTVVS